MISSVDICNNRVAESHKGLAGAFRARDEMKRQLQEMKIRIHNDKCRMNLAMGQSIDCEHGYDVCPKCDPCTCDTPAKAYDRAMDVV